MIIIQESLLETVYLIETGFNKLNENKTVVLLSLIELYLYYTILYKCMYNAIYRFACSNLNNSIEYIYKRAY